MDKQIGRVGDEINLTAISTSMFHPLGQRVDFELKVIESEIAEL